MSVIERPNQVSFIQLKGEPYQRMLGNGTPELVDCNFSLDALARNSGFASKLPTKIDKSTEHLQPLFSEGGYYSLDEKLKHGQDLTFAEAFSLIAFVTSALNKPLRDVLVDKIQNLGPHETHMLQAVALLSSMSTKEGFASLTPDEIAGMVAATLQLDTVARVSYPEPVLAFGGMGGDKGYPLGHGRSKLFSLSTLSAVASANVGPTHKHHSYPNTSKVAGQSAIEASGARSDFHSLATLGAILKEANLLMTSCHNTRTLHTLSHLLRGETINHVIGPLAFTLAESTPAYGFIGVNEKIHPETIILALQKLNETGYQTYSNSAVFCGTDLKSVHKDMLDPTDYYASREAKKHIRLDEVAPPPFISLVSFLRNGQCAGTFVLRPEDFYSRQELEQVRFEHLVVPNTAEAILHFNTEALSGRDETKSRYLAMTIGLGIFTRNYLGQPNALDIRKNRVNPLFLQRATQEGYELLKSGQAMEKLQSYVKITKAHAGYRGDI